MNKIKYFIISLFAVFTVCFFAPLNFVIPNYAQINIILEDTFKIYFIISVIATLLFSLIFLIPNKKILKLISSIIFTAGIFVYFEMLFIMPHLGKLDGRVFDIKSYIPLCIFEIVFAALIIFVLIRIFKKENFIDLLYKTSLFLIILQIFCFIPNVNSMTKLRDISEGSIYSFKKYTTDFEKYSEFSSKQNIIVVLMDAFGRGIFEEFLAKYPEYKSLFKDFEYYPNMLSFGGCTSTAVPTMFTGKDMDIMDHSEAYYEKLRENYTQKSSLLNVLKAHNYKNHIFLFSNDVMFLSPKYIDTLKSYSQEKTYGKKNKQFIKNTISFYALPLVFKKSPYKYFTDITIGKKRLKFTNEKHYIENAFYNNFNGKIKLSNDEKVFKYYHLRGLHTPYLLDEKFEIKDITEEKNDPLERTAKIYMAMLEQFLNRLKEAGIYDKSAIILMSDHGNGIYISPLQSEKESVINSLFLYKGFNENHDNMQVIDNIWPELEDFQNLIFYAAGITDKKWDIKNENKNKNILTNTRNKIKNIKLSKQDFNYTISKEVPAKIYTKTGLKKNLGLAVSVEESINSDSQYIVLEQGNDKYVVQFPDKERVLGSKVYHCFNIKAENVPNGIYDLKLLIKDNEGNFIWLKLPNNRIIIDKEIKLEK